jgi:hypothetical protein
LKILQRRRPIDQASIALLEHALAEPQRTYVLRKARCLMDTKLAVEKIANKNHETEEAKRAACMAVAPDFLRERVGQGIPLPEMRVQVSVQGVVQNSRPRGSDPGPEETRIAALQYVLGDTRLQGVKPMSADVFIDFVAMIAPRWDPNFERAGEGEGGNDNEEGNDNGCFSSEDDESDDDTV